MHIHELKAKTHARINKEYNDFKNTEIKKSPHTMYADARKICVYGDIRTTLKDTIENTDKNSKIDMEMLEAIAFHKGNLIAAIYAYRNGKWEKTGVRFADDHAHSYMIKHIDEIFEDNYDLG